MQFDIFLEELPQLKNNKLMGVLAHDQVMQTHIRNFVYKDVKHKALPKSSAVLACVYPDEQAIAKMVFILRKSYNGHHSGQISFPGGKSENIDKTLWHTALREAAEEVNLKDAQVQAVRELTPLLIPISNFMVYPFLAYTDKTPYFLKDEKEVASILEFPLIDILNTDLIEIKRTYFGKEYPVNAFLLQDYKIWGATAMILSEIRALFKRR